MLNGEKKISGTAAKLSRGASYHHCTLLVRVDTSSLHMALNNPAASIIVTNATKSVRSPVENLVNDSMVDSNITERLESAIAEEFAEGCDIKDVDPYEEYYKGIENIVDSYKSWSWVYGKTPKFTISEGDHEYQFAEGNLQLANNQVMPFNADVYNHLMSSNDTRLVRLANLIKDII